MKNGNSTAFIIAVTVAATLAPAAMAQTNCSTIENDIARLACYDETAKKAEPKTLLPGDAFGEFNGFASYAEIHHSVGTRSLDFELEDCVLQGNDSRLVDPYGVGIELKLNYFKVDLKEIQSFEHYLSIPTLVVITQKRNHTIKLVTGRIPVPFSTNFSGYDTLAVADQFDTSFGILHVGNSRTAHIKIALEPEDGKTAFELFSDLANACMGQG